MEPDIQSDDAALHSWKHDQLADAEELLTTVIDGSLNPTHHVLAGRALVRVRLGQYNTALIDAETVLLPVLVYTGANSFKPSPSRISRPSSVTSQRVGLLSASGKGTRAIGLVTLHSSASIPFSFSSRSVFFGVDYLSVDRVSGYHRIYVYTRLQTSLHSGVRAQWRYRNECQTIPHLKIL